MLAGWAVTFFEGSQIIVAVGQCRTYVIGVGTVIPAKPQTNEDEMSKMDKKTKAAKISEMCKIMKEYDRRGDVVLREQMKRTIEEAKDTW